MCKGVEQLSEARALRRMDSGPLNERASYLPKLVRRKLEHARVKDSWRVEAAACHQDDRCSRRRHTGTAGELVGGQRRGGTCWPCKRYTPA